MLAYIDGLLHRTTGLPHVQPLNSRNDMLPHTPTNCSRRGSLCSGATARKPDTGGKEHATGSATSSDDGHSEHGTKPLASRLFRLPNKAPATGTSPTGAVDASSDGNTKNSALEQIIAADEAAAKNDAVVVPVFKFAVRLVKDTLWKDEVRQISPRPSSCPPHSSASTSETKRSRCYRGRWR